MGNVCSACEDGKKRSADGFSSEPEQIPQQVLDALKQLKDEDGKNKLQEIINASRKNVFANKPAEKDPSAAEQSFTNGSYYQGQMIDKKKWGQGKYISKEGRVYEGQWLSDKCDGKGSLKDLESFYYGFWQGGSKQGDGFEVWHADGTVYIGDHKSSMKNGFGVYIWKDGTRYVGQFANDVIEGEGVFYDTDGVYKGAFVDSLQQGSGTYSYNDGAVYTGDFHEGERHGQGKITWPDGSSYEGGWKEGHMHGDGTVVVRGKNKQKVTYENGSQLSAVPFNHSL
ncbi:unnamed protein product [Amoebophrya sp. A120]|nr:unnamed protein product [Amoebophrya sp. A120]|eukprot:GSA120T00006772001.1